MCSIETGTLCRDLVNMENSADPQLEPRVSQGEDGCQQRYVDGRSSAWFERDFYLNLFKERKC